MTVPVPMTVSLPKMHPRDVYGLDAPLPEAELAVLRDIRRSHTRLDTFRRRQDATRKEPEHGPTPERRNHGAGIVVSPKTMSDANGRIGQPHIVIDTLEAMERRGTITRQMHQAGAQFRIDFRAAGMDALRAASMEGARGGGDGACITERQEMARRRVHDALAVLGGRQSPAGACLWSVLGEECTLKEWAGKNGWGIRALSEHSASGVLIAALCALTTYYGR